MTRILNPFIYSKAVSPTQFIGREEIITDFYNGWAGANHSSIAINGEHGIGKTSLLHYLIDLAQKEQWGIEYGRNIYIDLYCPSLGEFNPTHFWSGILNDLKQKENNLDLHRYIDTLLQQQEIATRDIQNLLRRLHQQQLFLILLLDGFSWFIETVTVRQDDLISFLSSLRALADHPTYSLTMITVTHKTLDELCAQIVKDYPGSKFYNNFIFRTLSPFTPEEIEILFDQTLNASSFEFTPRDRKFLYRLAGTHPTLVQMAGYHLFEVRRDGPLDDRAYQRIIKGFEKDAAQYFRLFWDNSTAQEKMLLILILLINLQFDVSNLSVEQVFQSHPRELEKLKNRGLIIHRDGDYELSSLIFAGWIVFQNIFEDKTLTETLFFDRALRLVRKTFEDLPRDTLLDRLHKRLTGDIHDHSLLFPEPEAVPSQNVTPESADPKNKNILRRQQIENLILINHRRLQILKDKKAMQGISTPAEILMEIEDIEKEIEKLQRELERLKNGDL
jgi:hypothetical protein